MGGGVAGGAPPVVARLDLRKGNRPGSCDRSCSTSSNAERSILSVKSERGSSNRNWGWPSASKVQGSATHAIVELADF